MNTPSHVAASLLVWRGERRARDVVAVVVGALLPDAPMFWFYGWEKFVNGRSERDLWTELYFQDGWQNFFDAFNSIPIALAIVGICMALKFRVGVLVAASALLHMLCDLPLHNDDAHRHFWPHSFVFASPVSYWDPRYYGLIVMPLELLFAVVASAYVGIRGGGRSIRIAAWITLGFIVAGLSFAAVMWGGLLFAS